MELAKFQRFEKLKDVSSKPIKFLMMISIFHEINNRMKIVMQNLDAFLERTWKTGK